MLVGAVDTAWGSPFSPLGRQIPAAQGSAQNRRAEGAVEGLAAPQSPSGYPAPPRLECQPLCLAEVPQEPGHRCQGLVAGIPWGARFSPGAASCQLCLCLETGAWEERGWAGPPWDSAVCLPGRSSTLVGPPSPEIFSGPWKSSLCSSDTSRVPTVNRCLGPCWMESLPSQSFHFRGKGGGFTGRRGSHPVGATSVG